MHIETHVAAEVILQDGSLLACEQLGCSSSGVFCCLLLGVFKNIRSRQWNVTLIMTISPTLIEGISIISLKAFVSRTYKYVSVQYKFLPFYLSSYCKR